MEKQQFNITIAAPAEKVWNILWSNETYPQWTAVFSPGSRAETNWQKGSKVLFLDSRNMGLVSTIADVVPNQFMSFRHLGEVKNGVEDTTSASVQQWASATESYTLSGTGGHTHLTVDIDLTNEMKEYFMKTFPQALEKVKELAEANG